MILKLGMKHLMMELYKVYINHDPGGNDLVFYSMFNMSTIHLNGGK